MPKAHTFISEEWSLHAQNGVFDKDLMVPNEPGLACGLEFAVLREYSGTFLELLSTTGLEYQVLYLVAL